MDATAAKRKRPAAAVDDEVSDAEVEEFYAILRRMRDASRRLCGRPPARAPAWRPSFSWEDFAPAAPQQAQARPDEEERGPRDDADAAAAPPRAGIDLNVEPEPDTPSSASTPAPATAPATPRSARAQA